VLSNPDAALRATGTGRERGIKFTHRLSLGLRVIAKLDFDMASTYQINIVDDSLSHLSPTLLQNLSQKTVPVPEPGPGSILVRMHAAALNFRDLLCVANSPVYPVRTLPGLVPCSDGSGEIVKAGPDSKWAGSIGQAVILVPNRDWLDGDVSVVQMSNTLGAGDVNGTLAQYVVVEDTWVVKAPKNLSYEEAAALVSTAGTAINVLGSIDVREGTTVVTQGTGGVSCAVIQVRLFVVVVTFRMKWLIKVNSTQLRWVLESSRRPQQRKSCRSRSDLVLRS
jgi:D-arabinose 1-dehydrogenase-like Zn-dependent alcohol dehydrogenase